VDRAAKAGQVEAKMAKEAALDRERELREANAKIAKLSPQGEEMRKAAAEARSQPAAKAVDKGDDFRKQAEREAAERKPAEARLAEVKERLEKQQRRHDEQLKAMRSGKEGGSSSSSAGPPAAAASDSDDLDELRRQLAAALDELAKVKDEYEKKKEAWRISSLKRHAEMNKLEQALKVSTTNEQLLKKKSDMLELTVLSHQKSMDKGRANIVAGQLKEHNERLEQQTQVKDLHANATQRKTFDETYDRQMDALNGKLKKLQ